MKLFYIIIIFCGVLGFCNISSVQGGEFKMPITKKGVWKGIVPINFKGRVIDSKTNEIINKFTVSEIINGMPSSGQIETEGKVIDIGPQTIKTAKGNYKFTLYIATLNGQTIVRNTKQVRVLGPASESIIIQISAEGYENKIISIAKHEILVGEDNSVDISLNPAANK